MKKFVKEKKTARKLFLFLVGLVFLLANVMVFNVFLGKPFNFTNAFEAVTFNQLIKPFDLVENATPIEKENKKMKELGSADFRIITPLGNDEEENAEIELEKIKVAPITTFSGTSLYPNSEVFLDVHSDRFFSSTLSDNEGHWTWTNYGNPLEKGDHTIEAYSIAPTEVNNKRDLLAQKYFFTVVDETSERFNVVALGDSKYVEKGGNDDLGDRIKLGGLESTYVFSAMFPSKSEYSFGDDMKIQLLFRPLAEKAKSEAELSYTISREYENFTVDKEPSSIFSDKISLNEGGYFLKNIKLKENVISGPYVLKIMAKVGKDTYYQSLRFNITSKALMTIGANTVTVEKFGQVLVFNVIFVMVVLIILISLILSEFRRFMVYKSVDENTLKRGGYFTK